MITPPNGRAGGAGSLSNMRILLAIASLGLVWCAEGCGPPGYSLEGLCSSQIQVGTKATVQSLVVTDDQETTKPPRLLGISGLDFNESDFISFSPGDMTITANRVDTGYLKLGFEHDDATFVVQVTQEATRVDGPCETAAVSVTER